MRLVRSAAELDEAAEAAGREARTAFGDGRLLYERYLERPRHIEIQLLADTHGTVIALGERECSCAAPPPEGARGNAVGGARFELRARMSDAAIRFAQAVGYVNAGTAEFVLEGHEFFFLELNGRIQVEHPVTEAVTGIDLVEQQLRIAQGERLELVVKTAGHAVEVRLYAEDPRSFLPQAGRIDRLRLPASIRVDAGAEEGDEVGTAYDPMIAKLIAHGAARTEALDALRDALTETEVSGVTTNLPFLRWLVAQPALRAGETTDRIPDRTSAPRPAGTAAAVSLAQAVSPQPAFSPTRAATRSRSGARARSRARIVDDHRADAGNGDPRARRHR